MALIGAILVEIKIIEILCERSLREGDRYALNHGIERRRTRTIHLSRCEVAFIFRLWFIAVLISK